jgi:hypothetical protein
LVCNQAWALSCLWFTSYTLSVGFIESNSMDNAGNLGPGRQPSEYQDLSIHSRGVQIFPNGTLLIHPASREHQGQYLCEATNGVGAGLSTVVSLVVHGKNVTQTYNMWNTISEKGKNV